jgi:hypothetical protein
VRRPDTDPRSVRQQGSRLVGLVEPAGDDDCVGRWLERLGQASRRRERGRLGQPLADERELEQRLRAGVHAMPA